MLFKLKAKTQPYIWGGTKLLSWGKTSSEAILAESWELSTYLNMESEIAEGDYKGKKITEVINPAILGKNPAKYPFFPILIKLIDAKEDLSIQVHPSDEYALKNENSYGKTEMWYVIEADEGAMLHIGFNKNVTEPEIKEHIEKGNISELMNHYSVKPGDSYFIPSGTIHAIGKGCLLCEVQQNSNLTYRVYDYGRLGKDGKPRELHVEKALQVLQRSSYEQYKFDGDTIAECKYFNVKHLTNIKNIPANTDSFMSFTIISGEGMANGISFKKGDTFFVSANEEVHFTNEVELILTSIL